MLMYEEGLRIREVLSLRVEDVSIRDKEINIRPRNQNENGAYIKLKKNEISIWAYFKQSIMAIPDK